MDRNDYPAGAVVLDNPVAPLAGSVDRNYNPLDPDKDAPLSLPSRGAWIEIASIASQSCILTVAPLTGSVDRNPYEVRVLLGEKSRSPHGERG